MSATATLSPAALLSAYVPGMSLIATPRTTLLGEGALDRTADPDRVPALLAAARSDAGQADPIAFGALPFGPDAPAHFTVPAVAHRAPALAEHPEAAGERRPLPGPWTAAPRPEPAAHAAAVRRALALLESAADPLEKAVLARSLRLTAPGPVDTGQVLRNLAARDPGGFTYAADLPPHAGPAPAPRTLVGASPELLVAKHGGQAASNPLAGSRPRSADPAADRRAAEELLASAKDRREHALVADAVAEGLRPFCTALDVPAEPSLARTATMWHLSTRVTGTLADPATPSLTLARALHPTPAVCGTPTGAALEAIGRLEPFDRGFYAGAVGYTDGDGDGEWAVAIRCAEVSGDALDLFAGGGIVAGSDPDAELAETSAKLRTLLQAIGVDRTL